MSHLIKKDSAMELQRKMQEDYYKALLGAKETGKKVVYTFVSGNLTSLIRSFDAIPLYPEIIALQAGMRRQTDDQIRIAEEFRHSEDVCTYVKANIGMMLGGAIGPYGETVPPPDLMILSYAGCFTYMKWFEVLKKMYPDVPVVMVHVPYQGDNKYTPEMIDYIVSQLKKDLIPAMEKLTGNKYDEEKVSRSHELAAIAEEDMVAVLRSPVNIPSPIDAFFAGVYYIGPMFNGWRGTQACVDYYRALRADVEDRIAKKLGPIGPSGVMDEKFRLVMDGAQSWISFQDNWELFDEWGVVTVGATYPKVGGFFEWGFRHDPKRPLESEAEYCLTCIANIGLKDRIRLVESYFHDFHADGFVIASIKSCNGFSACQLTMLHELEKRLGVSGAFIEYDIVDSRYYSKSNIKVRMESYLQMLAEKKLKIRAVGA